ncbi:TRAP transporter small permease subunit [Oceanobacillus salinisoli]|uniref:TRAP transporter small permease subunit n=1 Tax=Oceanobacillus salinisoli TaxID=2678611 RepID=UPI0012E29FC3|nr:TRAP transporter small permease [Oceanobacillus salinisoli]
MLANIEKLINRLTGIISRIGQVLLFSMVIFICISVVLRNANHPLIGNIEITTLLMVAIVNIGMLYAQSQEGHIKIGLVIDKLPHRIQQLMDIIESLLTLIVTFIIMLVYYNVSIRFFQSPEYTDLLGIPLYPLKFIIFVSFLLWTLIVAMKFLKKLISFLKLEG